MRLVGCALAGTSPLAAQTAPWARPHVFVGVDVGHDDQPITFVRPSAAAWIYLTNWTTIGANVSSSRFLLSDTASRQLSIASVTASQTLWKGIVAVDGEIGSVWRSWGASPDGIMNGRIVVRPASWATVTGRAEHYAYTSTEQSLSSAVMPTRYSATLGLSARSGWQGEIAFQDAHFDSFGFVPSGKNDVTAAYGWALAPVPGLSPGALQIGYSIAASNSTRLMYGLAQPSQRVPPTSSAFDLTGVYSPYYTPRDQLVHSALAAMTMTRGHVSYHMHGAFGFHATENAPHIVSAASTLRGPSPQIVETAREFTPWNARATMTSAVNANVSLVLGGEVSRTAFYSAQTASLSLDYTIPK